MVDVPSDGSRLLDRALDLLAMVIADDARRSAVALAREIGLPTSTAHRIVARLVAHGLLIRVGAGRYKGGFALAAMGAGIDRSALIAQVARPLLRTLAARTGRVAHLGSWEGEMVTYLVKEGRGGAALFTRESMQLEAYCSGIGKVLLANLEQEARLAYLAGGPFVALTERTLVDPVALADHLARVRDDGYATDDGEIAADIACLAVPVRGADRRVLAAISVTARGDAASGPPQGELLAALRECAARIEARLAG